MRLVISLADYFAVNIAVTLFRIVATCSAYLVLRFYKVISRAMKHFDKLCSLLLFIHSPRQAQNPSLTLVAIKWACIKGATAEGSKPVHSRQLLYKTWRIRNTESPGNGKRSLTRSVQVPHFQKFDRQITFQRISINETKRFFGTIHWIEIYPLERTIHL